jgi:hypothetical protein
MPFLKAAVILPIFAHFAGQDLRGTFKSLHTVRAKALLLLALPMSFLMYLFNRLRVRHTAFEFNR